MTFVGVQNITVPSFDASLAELDQRAIRWDIEQAAAHGFTATLLALNAGLSVDEMKQFVEIAVGAADRLQVGIEMPQMGFAVAAELHSFAADAGATHALLTEPVGWAPRDDDEYADAYAGLAEASSLRLVLPIAGPLVRWGAYGRLAALEPVQALHVTTPLPQILFAALQFARAGLEVGIGTPLLAGGLPLLAREYGVRWLAPAHWEMWQSPSERYIVDYLDHVVAGRKEEALAIHWRLGRARGIAFGAGLLDLELDGMPHWPMAKYMAWAVGGNGGVTREPALHIKPHQAQAQQAVLRSLGIEARSDEREFLVGRSAAGTLDDS
jgi:4-hydroxy-tetrahydrodipicolinate synthase